GRMPCYFFSIKRDCEEISLYVGFSYRFVTGARCVAAKPPADHFIIRPKALQCFEAPIGRIVVVIFWSATRPVVVDIHSLAAQMQAGGGGGLEGGGVAGLAVGQRIPAFHAPPEWRLPPAPSTARSTGVVVN